MQEEISDPWMLPGGKVIRKLSAEAIELRRLVAEEEEGGDNCGNDQHHLLDDIHCWIV